MNIYGCDFSGAKNPEGKIFIASGRLDGNSFIVEQVSSCEDRLDLFCEIRTTKAPWGMDFPFSIPEYYLEQQILHPGTSSSRELMTIAGTSSSSGSARFTAAKAAVISG